MPRKLSDTRVRILTKPQVLLLSEIAKQPRSASEAYPPIVKLLNVGFIVANEGKWSTVYQITDAGRAALAAAESTPA